jgi:hyperosmotically inducible periplasmic protein
MVAALRFQNLTGSRLRSLASVLPAHKGPAPDRSPEAQIAPWSSFSRSQDVPCKTPALQQGPSSRVGFGLGNALDLAVANIMRHLLLVALTAMTLSAQAPDNTKANQQDREGGVTADDQKMNKADRELAQKIRRSVFQDKSLSTYAHNVKIIVADGNVTIKGPVRTQQEKDTIQRLAGSIAGQGNVVNQLSVVPDNK